MNSNICNNNNNPMGYEDGSFPNENDNAVNNNNMDQDWLPPVEEQPEDDGGVGSLPVGGVRSMLVLNENEFNPNSNCVSNPQRHQHHQQQQHQPTARDDVFQLKLEFGASQALLQQQQGGMGGGGGPPPPPPPGPASQTIGVEQTPEYPGPKIMVRSRSF